MAKSEIGWFKMSKLVEVDLGATWSSASRRAGTKTLVSTISGVAQEKKIPAR